MEDIRPFPTIASFSNVFYAFFRAALGLLLLVRGINFIFNMEHLQELISESRFGFDPVVLSYVVSITHLFGGSLIVVGLLTRVAIILQIPILIAAVLFNYESAIFGTTSELMLSIAVLILLLFYVLKGPGLISMDHYRENHQL